MKPSGAGATLTDLCGVVVHRLENFLFSQGQSVRLFSERGIPLTQVTKRKPQSTHGLPEHRGLWASQESREPPSPASAALRRHSQGAGGGRVLVRAGPAVTRVARILMNLSERDTPFFGIFNSFFMLCLAMAEAAPLGGNE